ncbi:prepilin-type N-terminal cleavage/methylation domain-containing protein [Candidatus Desantisbacteria bacterium]|nr:prepilin-type N-terminal cleavage/methylation domain-containing protein [Candidatus Desantisbacteria bacterium]
MNLLKKDQAFTIVELMIVITIIIILMAVAVPNYMDARGKARDEIAKNTLKTVKSALEMYMAEKGGYPQTINTADELKSALTQDYWPNNLNTGKESGFLSDAFVNSTGTSFTIVAVGKDLEHCWQLSDTGNIIMRNSPNL